MGAVRCAGALLMLAAAHPSRAEPVDHWRPFMAEASTRFGIPIHWIERVIRAESGGMTRRAGRPIRSRVGAMGLMQLMPATWESMRKQLNLGSDPDAPRHNILAGTLYLRLLYQRFGYPGLFAAYNAGPSRYFDYLVARRALPAETIGYLASVGVLQIPIMNVAQQSPHTLFAVLSATVGTDTLSSRSRRFSASLFAIIPRAD